MPALGRGDAVQGDAAGSGGERVLEAGAVDGAVDRAALVKKGLCVGGGRQRECAEQCNDDCKSRWPPVRIGRTLGGGGRGGGAGRGRGSQRGPLRFSPCRPELTNPPKTT